jgi:hypothetical protein
MRVRSLVVCFGALASSVSSVNGACPNNCNQNGECISGGVCSCFRYFTGADCSLRQCPFGYVCGGVILQFTT